MTPDLCTKQEPGTCSQIRSRALFLVQCPPTPTNTVPHVLMLTLRRLAHHSSRNKCSESALGVLHVCLEVRLLKTKKRQGKVADSQGPRVCCAVRWLTPQDKHSEEASRTQVFHEGRHPVDLSVRSAGESWGLVMTSRGSRITSKYELLEHGLASNLQQNTTPNSRTNCCLSLHNEFIDSARGFLRLPICCVLFDESLRCERNLLMARAAPRTHRTSRTPPSHKATSIVVPSTHDNTHTASAADKYFPRLFSDRETPAHWGAFTQGALRVIRHRVLRPLSEWTEHLASDTTPSGRLPRTQPRVVDGTAASPAHPPFHLVSPGTSVLHRKRARGRPDSLRRAAHASLSHLQRRDDVAEQPMGTRGRDQLSDPLMLKNSKKSTLSLESTTRHFVSVAKYCSLFSEACFTKKVHVQRTSFVFTSVSLRSAQ